jgi:HK97 family phage prohead protease
MQRLERKEFSFATATKNSIKKTLTGIASVFNVVDAMNDYTTALTFANSVSLFQTAAYAPKVLLSHDHSKLPIAVIETMDIVGRDGLPEKTRRKHPEATGGLKVSLRYFDSERGQAAYEAAAAGQMEMSIGYTVEQSRHGKTASGEEVRELSQVFLHEISLVVFGACPSTTANAKMAENKRKLDKFSASIAAYSKAERDARYFQMLRNARTLKETRDFLASVTPTVKDEHWHRRMRLNKLRLEAAIEYRIKERGF